jgi:LmbE family N-acetylglucosaminyl deacetylase
MPVLRSYARRAAHALLFPVAEMFWTAVLGNLYYLVPNRPGHIVFSGQDRVLVLAPHPDDETLGCGGTISRHARAGDSVCVVVVTDGGRSRAHGLSRDEMVRLRHIEAREAVARLGPVDLEQWGFPEGEWHPEALQARLCETILRLRPSYIYTTSCVDFHPEHVRVGEALAAVLMTLPGDYKPLLRVYELQVPLTPILANMVCDISASLAEKRRALGAYRTQQGSFLWLPRHERYLRHVFRAAGPIEVFWQLTPGQFAAVMQMGRLRFRSIRLRPISDGLAWLIGTRSRLRLLGVAQGNKSGAGAGHGTRRIDTL